MAVTVCSCMGCGSAVRIQNHQCADMCYEEFHVSTCRECMKKMKEVFRRIAPFTPKYVPITKKLNIEGE